MPLSIVDIMNFTNYFSVLRLNFKEILLDQDQKLGRKIKKDKFELC